MRLAALALPALLWPIAAQARFAPPENQALRYMVTDERGDAGAPLVTKSGRRVIFHKTAEGYAADLTIESVDLSGPHAITAMAGHFMKTLTGRTIRYHLDIAGKVTGVEDQPALIADVVAAFRKMGTAPDADAKVRGAITDRIAQSIADAPEVAQRAMLASLLTPTIAADRTEESSGDRDVAVPATALGKSVALPGRETVLRRADRVTIVTRAEGPVSEAVASAPAAAPGAQRMRILDREEIDAQTGLLVSSDRTTESWLGDAVDRRSVAHLTISLSPVS